MLVYAVNDNQHQKNINQPTQTGTTTSKKGIIAYCCNRCAVVCGFFIFETQLSTIFPKPTFSGVFLTKPTKNIELPTVRETNQHCVLQLKQVKIACCCNCCVRSHKTQFSRKKTKSNNDVKNSFYFSPSLAILFFFLTYNIVLQCKIRTNDD